MKLIIIFTSPCELKSLYYRCNNVQYLSCTFNIISGAAVDYGGNSIGVGLVTWGFFSPARHQPPDHETADREATSTPQKYSQMIAAAIIQMQGISAAMLNIGNPWSHSYLAMDTICPILAPLRDRGGGGAAVGRGLAGSGFVSVCSAGYLLLGRMLFEW